MSRSHHLPRHLTHHTSSSSQFDLDRPASSPFGVGDTSCVQHPLSPSAYARAQQLQHPLSPTAQGGSTIEVDPAKQAPLLATLAAQGARVLVDLSAVASSFAPEVAREWTPAQLYDHLVARGVPAEDARVLRAQEVNGTNFSMLNDAQLERWGIAPWGRRVALVNALQDLAFGGRAPRPSELDGFDAHKERAALSLHNGGAANGYGRGPEYRPVTERERRERERELALLERERRYIGSGVDQQQYDDLDPRDGRVHRHTYLPSPVEAYRERERLQHLEDELLARSSVPRGLDRYGTAEENDPYYSRGGGDYGRDLAGLGQGLGALSIREREAELARREREREEAHLAREALRLQRRGVNRPVSATGTYGTTRYAEEDPRYGSRRTLYAEEERERRLGRSSSAFNFRSPASATGTVPLLSPLGSSGRVGLAPTSPYGTMSFEQAERERAADRAALARREREQLDAARYGAALGSPAARAGYGYGAAAGGYDSDEERLYEHPRLHGGYASYYKREFGRYAEPLQADVGGGNATRNSAWLSEFYMPVDVRSAAARDAYRPALQPPSYTLSHDPSAPQARLKLEWVYGYSSFHTRNNLVYNNVGDIIYPASGVVVVYKHRHRLQRHFQAHNDEVRAIAQHPVNLNVIASGQVCSSATTTAGGRDENGGVPHIAVWDSTDFARVWLLKLTPQDRSIRALAFSGDGRYLASVSNDADHTVKLWEWETRTLLGSARGDSYALHAIKWNHKDPSEFVTAGKQHAVFWRWDGAKLTARKAHIPGNKVVSFFSVAFSEKGYACLGGDDGGIYVFVDGRLVREFKRVHKGKVLCLDWFPGGLISGGGDGVVHVLDKKLDVLRSFTFHHRITALYVRGNQMLVGTQGAQIFEIADFMHTQVEGDNQAGSASNGGQPLLPLQGGTGAEFQSPTGRIGIEPIVQGHYDGELHALAMGPGGREVLTAGEDNQLCVWELTTHRLLRRAHISDVPGPQLARKARPNASSSSHPLHQCARALAVSPNGKFVSLGTNAGELVVYTAADLRRVHSHDLSQYSKRAAHAASSAARHHSSSSSSSTPAHPHWVSCMKYSPSGHTLAVGTHGAVIVLLDTRDEYRVKGVLSSHDSFITAVDWSEDGAFLASTDGLYHLKFHQIFENDLAQSALVLDPQLVRDARWVSQSSVLGYATQGVLEAGESEGTLVSCLEVSPSRALIVSGDDAGQVQLFNFPALSAQAHSHAYHTHASHVAAVRWSTDEKYVLSVGGHDNTMAQWRVV